MDRWSPVATAWGTEPQAREANLHEAQSGCHLMDHVCHGCARVSGPHEQREARPASSSKTPRQRRLHGRVGKRLLLGALIGTVVGATIGAVVGAIGSSEQELS